MLHDVAAMQCLKILLFQVRHETICAKNAQSSTKRRPFDTKKQRLRGTELESYQQPRVAAQSETKYAIAAQKKANWRRKHEEFIQSIRSARSFNSTSAPSLFVFNVGF